MTLLFKNSSPGLLLNALIAEIGAGLFFLAKPWKAKMAESRHFMGVGAFNMVRTSVYRSIGEHRKIRLQVVDDMYLGKLVKQSGFRQECMLAESLVSLPWYCSVPAMISGLMKNVYAFFSYRPGYVFLGVSIIALLTVVPLAGAVFARGMEQLFFIGAVLLRVAGIGGGHGTPRPAACVDPVSADNALYFTLYHRQSVLSGAALRRCRLEGQLLPPRSAEGGRLGALGAVLAPEAEEVVVDSVDKIFYTAIVAKRTSAVQGQSRTGGA